MCRVQDEPFPPAAFIVGAPRSGTTLLRMMLDSHPEMAIPPESHFYFELLKELAAGGLGREEFFNLLTRFFTWDDFEIEREAFRGALESLDPFTVGDGVRAFYATYAAKFGKSRWGEKTPDYGNIMPAIEALLPEAHFIHLIRDGRDVALSKRHLWFGPGESILAQAEDWTQWILRARGAGARCRHYLEIQYERLLAAPEEVLRLICEFLKLPFCPEMLAYHKTAGARLEALKGWKELELSGEKLRSVLQLTTEPPRLDRIARWKRELPGAEIGLFDEIAGPLLSDLGYEVGAAVEANATATTRPRRAQTAMSVSALLLTDGITDDALPWFTGAREQVDEFVVWIDTQKAPPETEERVRPFATRIEHFEPNGFADPFLLRAIESCKTDWILRLDSDEQLSAEWEQPAWRELLSLGDSNFALPRRWITPTGQFLARAPWWPDFQVRLFRNTPGKICFNNQVHGTLEIEGRRAYCRSLALQHHVLWMLDRAAREAKVRFYQTLAGPDLGHYYLFEDYDVPERPVPMRAAFDLDLELLRMGMMFAQEAADISMSAVMLPEQVSASAQLTAPVQLRNGTARTLCSGLPFPLNLCYHWIDRSSGAVAVFDGERTPIFPPVPPQGSAVFEMTLKVPPHPGDYILHLTAVQEGVRWLEEAHPGFGVKAVVQVK
ncbi:MAG: sulfotransferase [Chthoniobacterales bacterium]